MPAAPRLQPIPAGLITPIMSPIDLAQTTDSVSSSAAAPPLAHQDCPSERNPDELAFSFEGLHASSPAPDSEIPDAPPVQAGPSGSSSQPQHPKPIANELPCRGVLIRWEAGSVWSTYPYHQHALREHPWEPVAIENNEWFRLRAKDCTCMTANNDGCCNTCRNVPVSE